MSGPLVWPSAERFDLVAQLSRDAVAIIDKHVPAAEPDRARLYYLLGQLAGFNLVQEETAMAAASMMDQAQAGTPRDRYPQGGGMVGGGGFAPEAPRPTLNANAVAAHARTLHNLAAELADQLEQRVIQFSGSDPRGNQIAPGPGKEEVTGFLPAIAQDLAGIERQLQRVGRALELFSARL